MPAPFSPPPFLKWSGARSWSMFSKRSKLVGVKLEGESDCRGRRGCRRQGQPSIAHGPGYRAIGRRVGRGSRRGDRRRARTIDRGAHPLSRSPAPLAVVSRDSGRRIACRGQIAPDDLGVLDVYVDAASGAAASRKTDWLAARHRGPAVPTVFGTPADARRQFVRSKLAPRGSTHFEVGASRRPVRAPAAA